jgi:hypothetical protein
LKTDRHQKDPENGAEKFTKLASRVNRKKPYLEPLHCGTEHTNKYRDNVHVAGFGLKNASGTNQRTMLLLWLRHVGSSGINTLEGEACGYLRIATRIQELKERGWKISSQRENVIGADGLFHKRIARYILDGRTADFLPVQLDLDFSARSPSSSPLINLAAATNQTITCWATTRVHSEFV